MNPKIIVICILFSALAQTCVYCDSFDPKMVHLVDFDNGNFFFRCNEPKINGTFVPETLVGVMKEVLKGTELVFPEDYYLHDVNVLTPFTKLDYGDILLEKNYFKAHPERGNFYSFPITGSIEAPWLYSPEKQYQDSLTFDTWDFDELTKRTELVGELMGKFGNAKEQDKPNVVFVHCEEGKDRTGEFSGAYEMRYLKQNLQQVADHDQQIAGRPIFPNFSNHLVWYCMYLKYKVGYTIDCNFEH
ncbi:phosphatase [Anaeramoeba flamelloides]|uniref:Phosphatase n=1 Tax=Anaeramoeba flamelloides TaxID=1746091 RepID=A0ABQ8Y219_9EUKA|nr:phosphatase [Anaeramoeba flamelloides]